MSEIWKDVFGYEGLYQVSNFGNVRSLKWNHSNQVRLLSPFDNGGYKRVGFRQKGKLRNFLIHVLVATAFIPNLENKPCVNHIDGNKENNCVSNLEWVTCSENTIHAKKHNLIKEYPSRWNPQKICQISPEGKIIAVFSSQREASRKLCMSQSQISNAISTGKEYRGSFWVKC